jgi:hypothetical protein
MDLSGDRLGVDGVFFVPDFLHEIAVGAQKLKSDLPRRSSPSLRSSQPCTRRSLCGGTLQGRAGNSRLGYLLEPEVISPAETSAWTRSQ